MGYKVKNYYCFYMLKTNYLGKKKETIPFTIATKLK
jgi:hypothetical protein